MKKIFSIFAFMAMLCIPFCLVSCGDDDDDSVTPSTQPGIYTITISGADVGDTGTKVIEFIKEKLGKDFSIEGAGGYIYTMVVKDKAKADAIIKDLEKYKAEIDKLVKENANLKSFNLTISANFVQIYEYDYTIATSSELISYGTYTYTDEDGAVWSFTYTDKDAGEGKKVGSLVVPKDINGVKAGTYEGKCKIYSTAVAFESDQMQGNVVGDIPVVYASFGFVYANSRVPATLKVNGTMVFRGEFFQKVE